MSNQPITLANLRVRFQTALNEENAFTRLLGIVEAKTKLNREYIAYGNTHTHIHTFIILLYLSRRTSRFLSHSCRCVVCNIKQNTLKLTTHIF